MFDKPQQQASQDNLFSANFPPVGGFPAPPAGMENFPIPPAGMEGLNLPAHLWMPFQMPSVRFDPGCCHQLGLICGGDACKAYCCIRFVGSKRMYALKLQG